MQTKHRTQQLAQQYYDESEKIRIKKIHEQQRIVYEELKVEEKKKELLKQQIEKRKMDEEQRAKKA